MYKFTHTHTCWLIVNARALLENVQKRELSAVLTNDETARLLSLRFLESAANHWRLLNGTKLLPDVIAGVVFNDGIKAQVAAA